MTRSKRTFDGATGRALGPRNPAELGPQRVELFETEGVVRTARAFAAQNTDLLRPNEATIVGKFLSHLPDERLPPPLDRCLTRSAEQGSTAKLTARRSGARSAYVSDHALKLKGCRVAPEVTYPFHRLQNRRVERVDIPFGVMSAEGVMRELLAYCFHLEHEIKPHSIPFAVYTYGLAPDNHGHCLILASANERRVEEYVSYPAITPVQIREWSIGQVSQYMYPIGSELLLRGINLWQWIEWKAEALSAMNMAGGFRGLLNSNIGNDVVADEEGNQGFYLCDFDSFRVIEVPDQPDQEYLVDFLLNAMLEVAKGSLPILDYIDIPTSWSQEERAVALSAYYFEHSSLWRAYRRHLLIKAKNRGWPTQLLDPALGVATTTEAAATVFGEKVLNSDRLRRIERDRGVFYPHN